MPADKITSEGDTIAIVVLYDPRDGKIAHIHGSAVDAGSTLPDHATIEKEARDYLARYADKGRPRTRKLSVLHVDPKSFKPRASYKVDPKKRVLVEAKRSR